MSIPRTMQAVEAHAQGPADHLRVVTRPVPEPGPGQILIRVEAASLNYSDVKRRRGDPYPFPTSFPFVPGGEVAGTVAALGPGVAGPPVGTPVFALAGIDGRAEAATATERAIGLTENPAVRAFLIARLAEVAGQAEARDSG